MQNNRPYFNKLYTAVILLLAFAFVFPLSISAADKKKFVVVIDPGHGGNDFGAIENGVNEKDVNLAVALRLGEMIQKKLKDTQVVYTRNSDKFISLQNRADIANNVKGDLFISIHCNSVDRSNKNRSNVLGATTYVLGHHKDADNLNVAKRENAVVELDANDKSHFSQYNPEEAESNIIFEMAQKKNFQNSVRFASDVQKQMASAGRYSRGVQQAGFWVLWSTAMPAALIELDFLCNPEQAKFLNSKDGQEKLAGAIFNAVKSYESFFRKNLGTAQAADSYSPETLMAFVETDEEPASLPTRSAESAPAVEQTRTAELPAPGTSTSPRRHRSESTAATSTQKNPASRTHRRRSSSARAEGASQVEEATIAMAPRQAVRITESADDNVLSDTEKPQTKDSKKSKASKKENAKASKKDEASKPARRDRDKTPGRKAVKQNVNVRYKILLFSSDEELKANDEVFQGLSPVSSFRENNKFNYTYGESQEYKEMEQLLKEVIPLFPDARVIKRYL